MAFIEFADAAPAGLPIAHSALFAVPKRAVRAAEAEAPFIVTQPLSELERRVVVLAREDRMETLRPVRQRSWLARVILAPRAPRPFSPTSGSKPCAGWRCRPGTMAIRCPFRR